ncbi:hypothetical protein LOAG_13267 [Loa loa]|uniref:Uncharacterized protein n=1 Tax=Loa loa TaxID=7209 RepID=A0A1I7W2F4_LOALO|nr:hypothetical protein LOAG_13267 [Loa loa]EFO15245.1 hypothetical protein LOAG_13267 [Loa loa]
MSDYEILDPAQNVPKPDDEAGPPSTPMLSSVNQSLVAAGPAIGGSKRENENSMQKGKAILGKKDAEIQLKHQKRKGKSGGKMIKRHNNDIKLSEKEYGQTNGDYQFEEIYGNFLGKRN